MPTRAGLLPLLAVALTLPAQSLDPLKPLVVMINGDAQGAGLVFRVDPQGRAWIATALHVVADKKNLKVRFYGTDDDVSATLRDEASAPDDLAVIVAPAPARYAFPFDLLAPSANERDTVYALGNPGGKAWSQTLLPSIVAEVGSSKITIESTVITNGYSGGALADASGRLLGMVLNTNGTLAEVLRLDRAAEVLRRDLRLTVEWSVRMTRDLSLPPYRGARGLTPGTPRTNPNDGLVYRWIPPGTFQMGCSPGDNECFPVEKPPRRMTISQGFWIGETEVTQAAYAKVSGANPSYFKGPGLPVEQVTWDEATKYCTAVGLRLPSEAEWEYAGRAGTPGARYGNLDAIAWYKANSGSKTHNVGGKTENAWGLRDMLGNVWEWTSDWYEPNQTRVLRGGSWDFIPEYVRVSYRIGGEPAGRYDDIGFRCAGEFR